MKHFRYHLRMDQFFLETDEFRVILCDLDKEGDGEIAGYVYSTPDLFGLNLAKLDIFCKDVNKILDNYEKSKGVCKCCRCDEKESIDDLVVEIPFLNIKVNHLIGTHDKLSCRVSSVEERVMKMEEKLKC